MVRKTPKAPPEGGRAFEGFDVQGSNIDRHHTPQPPEYQAPRLAAYRLSVDLVVEGCRYV